MTEKKGPYRPNDGDSEDGVGVVTQHNSRGDGDEGYVNLSVAICAIFVVMLGVLLVFTGGYWLIGGVSLVAVGLLVLAAELAA